MPEVGRETQKLIIQRKLGHKQLMPGAAQWDMLTDRTDECYICGHYILTFFIWTKRIGQLAKEKDENVV